MFRGASTRTGLEAAGRTMKFESLCRFLPYRASIMSNFKNKICRGEADEEYQKGYYKSVIDKELGNIKIYSNKFSQADIWKSAILKPLFEVAPADGHVAAREHDMLHYIQVLSPETEKIANIPEITRNNENPETFSEVSEGPAPVVQTELIMSQHGEEVDKDLLGQVWEAPLSLSEPDSDMPFKGTKSAVKVFYQTRYSSPPTLPNFYPIHWIPDVVILEGMNMIYKHFVSLFTVWCTIHVYLYN